MDEENTVENTSEEKASLKDVQTLLAELEAKVADGSLSLNEAIDEVIAKLEGMKDAEPGLNGLGKEEKFPLPEPEE